jgi:hypothetical protein
MTSHRRYLRRARTAAVLALCVPLSASAGALAEPAVDRATQQSTPKIGDTPADFAQPVAPAPKLGDTPADHPGMPDASAGGTTADPAPTPIEAPDTGGFDWASAAIGAGGAGVLIIVSLGGVGLASRGWMRIAR